MLTMEARKRSTSYQFQNQMVNVGWVAGWLEKTREARRIIVHQGSKREFGIPIDIKEGETLRPGFKDGSPIKVTCRVTGRFLREQGERVAALRVLDMDNPTVLDMQPYERRRGKSNGSNGNGAEHPAETAVEPAAEGSQLVKPKLQHRVLLPDGIKARLSGSANFFRIAGYVGGVAVEPGKMREDGRPGEPCLVILLRQDDNPDNAIPVRCYNRLAEAIADKLPIGIPIIINDGEVKIRVVPNAAHIPQVEGAEPVEVTPAFFTYPYIRARVPKIASQDHILAQPKWAEEMLKDHLRAKASRAMRAGKAAAAPAVGNTEVVAAPATSAPLATGAGGNGSGDGGIGGGGNVEQAAAPAPKKPPKASLSAIAPE